MGVESPLFSPRLDERCGTSDGPVLSDSEVCSLIGAERSTGAIEGSEVALNKFLTKPNMKRYENEVDMRQDARC